MKTDRSDLTASARDFALASALASYPDEEVEQTIRSLCPALAGHVAAARFVAALDEERGFDELRAAYVGTFDRGDGRISLYETEYGRMRGMAKGNELADISGFYRAFGLVPDQDRVHEMLDHVAVELEFYAVLLAKQRHLDEAGDREGGAIVEDARRKFLAAHLGPLAKAVGSRAKAVGVPAYGDVLAWCGALVADECARLGVVPAPLDFFEDEERGEEMRCGNVRLPVVS